MLRLQGKKVSSHLQASPHSCATKSCPPASVFETACVIECKANCRGVKIMNGQWAGRYSGSTTGLLVIDLDDMGTHYEGRAYAYEDNHSLPRTFVIIRTSNKESAFQLTLETHPIDPRTEEPTS